MQHAKIYPMGAFIGMEIVSSHYDPLTPINASRVFGSPILTFQLIK